MDEENKQLEAEETNNTQTVSKEEEYLNNWKRERADFLNYKKEEAKRIEQFARFASEDVILETIEIVDDLELAHQNFAKQNLGGQAGELNKGLEQVVKKFKDLFKKYGVQEIVIDTAKFDPTLQEAIETEIGGENIVQVRSGYMMHDKVLRPARVKITK